MDNRMNTIEDSQSTPEHRAGNVGGPGFAHPSDAELGATPGGLRKAMLDSEHDAHAPSVNQQESQMANDWSRGSQGSAAGKSDWRARMTQGAQSMRTSASAHPLAIALVAIGLVLTVASFMRSRSGGQ